MPTDSFDFSHLGPIVSAAIHELPPNPCFGQIVNAAVHDLPPIEVGGFTDNWLLQPLASCHQIHVSVRS